MQKFKSSYLKNINLKSGTLDYDSFEIDPNAPFEKQKFLFTEDLIQIGFGENLCVDVGYYPALKPDGFFKVVVILDCDWTKPIYKKRIKSLEEMRKCLQEAIDIANEMYRSQVDNKLILS